MNPNKDCTICVYNGVCQDRKEDPAITDCCVPEAPLRALQAAASTAVDFINCTNTYVAYTKAKSAYWISINK